MPYCEHCNKTFRTAPALEQHVQDSPAHNIEFDCDDCQKTFNSQQALDQHLRDSPVHQQTFECVDCGRDFSSQAALDQHFRDSPLHQPTVECVDCSRDFSSQQALDQHLQDAPVHQEKFDCQDCNKSFKSKQARDDHFRDSPVHQPVFRCHDCERSFVKPEYLAQHVRDSAACGQSVWVERSSTGSSSSIPDSNDDFASDDTDLTPLVIGLTGVSIHDKVSENKQSKSQQKQKKANRFEVVEQAMKQRYGDVTKLDQFQALCADVGISPIPPSITQCRQALSRVNVNIFDLHQSRLAGNLPQKFPSCHALAVYSHTHSKFYPKQRAKAEGAVRALLKNLC